MQLAIGWAVTVADSYGRRCCEQIDAHNNYQALVDAGTVDGSARYITQYTAGTNGDAELGFTTYYMQCGAPAEAVTGVACDFDPQNDNDNIGVIALSNSGPGNQVRT